MRPRYPLSRRFKAKFSAFETVNGSLWNAFGKGFESQSSDGGRARPGQPAPPRRCPSLRKGRSRMHRSPPDGQRMPLRRSVLGHLTRPRTWTLVAALACTGAAMLPTGARTDMVPDAQAAPAPVGQGFVVVPSDLAFILKQIKIAERHSRVLAGNEPTQGPNPHPASDPMYCQSMIGTGPDQIPSPLLSFGLRPVDGS